MSGERCDLLCLDLPRAQALRADLLPGDVVAVAAARAKALADPTRLTIAASLRTGELCVCDLSWICGRAENLVSHHVRALRAAGLLHSRREGRMVMYDLTAQGRTLLDTVLAIEVTA